MFSGKLQRKRVENLDAFWPGVEVLICIDAFSKISLLL